MKLKDYVKYGTVKTIQTGEEGVMIDLKEMNISGKPTMCITVSFNGWTPEIAYLPEHLTLMCKKCACDLNTSHSGYCKNCWEDNYGEKIEELEE